MLLFLLLLIPVRPAWQAILRSLARSPSGRVALLLLVSQHEQETQDGVNL